MNLLVTGAAGFIGANFVRYWQTRHPADTIVALDALTYAGNRASLPAETPQFIFVHGSILDAPLLDSTMDRHQIDTVVHFAAESHVDRSIRTPETFLETNVTGTFRLLEAARRRGVQTGRTPRFHHVSTDEVYGSLQAGDPAFSEETPYAPNSPYAASKAASDHLVRAWHHTYGLPVTTSNCSNNYGPYHFPEKLIPLMIANILHGKPLPVYGDGSNIRDWLYVEDHCAGIELVLAKGRPGETYNIGGNNECPNIVLVQTLCALADEIFAGDASLARQFPLSPCARSQNASSLIQFVKDRPGHDWRYAIDASKAARELGYVPQESLQTGLRKTFEWYLHNTAWWTNIMDDRYEAWMRSNYSDRSRTGEKP